MPNHTLPSDGKESLEDIPTPCVLVCERRFEANLARMQTRANDQGVQLRPHVKTHKSARLAQRQVELGAAGLTVAKVGEAEIFAARGFDDLRVGYPLVQKQQFERIEALQRQGIRISFLVDSATAARAASEYFAGESSCASVLLKIDCGYGRVGFRWDNEEIGPFADWLDQLDGLDLIGVLTHAGQSYRGPEDGETREEALARVAAEERDRTLSAARKILRSRGDAFGSRADFEVSIGSTPSMSAFENRSRQEDLRVTEIRPGNYVFNDLTQVALGVADLEQCALTVLATVVSAQKDHHGMRYILDAGRKVLTSDLRYGSEGYGLALEGLTGRQPRPGAVVPEISEEHAQLRLRVGSLAPGDRIRLVPNHSCVVVNTQDELVVERADGGLERINVDARGKTT